MCKVEEKETFLFLEHISSQSPIILSAPVLNKTFSALSSKSPSLLEPVRETLAEAKKLWLRKLFRG